MQGIQYMNSVEKEKMRDVYRRTRYFDGVVEGTLVWRQGTISTMVGATQDDYRRLLKLIGEGTLYENMAGTSSMLEIMENKWFIHAHDLHGPLT